MDGETAPKGYLDARAARTGLPSQAELDAHGPWAVAATTFDPDEAGGLHALLRGADIPALVLPPYRLCFLEPGLLTDGFRVWVPESRLREAQALVAQAWPEERAAMEAESAAEDEKERRRPAAQGRAASGPSLTAWFLAISPLAPIVVVAALLRLRKARRLEGGASPGPAAAPVFTIALTSVAALFTIAWALVGLAILAHAGLRP